MKSSGHGNGSGADSTRHRHSEAYCLMTYSCGKHIEVLWNSRDGVTPFMLGCLQCHEMMQHVGPDEYKPTHQLTPGQRYFVDMKWRKCRQYGVPFGAPDVRVG